MNVVKLLAAEALWHIVLTYPYNESECHVIVFVCYKVCSVLC